MLSFLFSVDTQVALGTEMASSPKIWGTLLALLCILCTPLAHSKDVSWREFMKLHYLSPSREFKEYKCDVLMREKEALKGKSSHMFIYVSWYKIEHVCISDIWMDRFRNAYVWVQNPLKVLKCHQENSKSNYTESRSFNYIEFHCGMDGYVDSIEDLKMVEPISN
ncbi:Epididymal secretory protein E3-beta [Saguinus oedipus]|uniref:Epididymal secretory protein E3-beta n=1 Tax=Saguinus oedipus TaxID=9490 RepID=A0ABQ9V456_SAGOE|nr:Epididymal secretory protein E3-beta [Saguinus oedipus]